MPQWSDGHTPARGRLPISRTACTWPRASGPGSLKEDVVDAGAWLQAHGDMRIRPTPGQSVVSRVGVPPGVYEQQPGYGGGGPATSQQTHLVRVRLGVKSPVSTTGKPSPACAATNSATEVTCRQRTADCPGAEFSCVVKNGTGLHRVT